MKKKVVLITGGAGGIGVATGQNLKEFKLVISDYADDVIQKTVDSYNKQGFDAVGFKCDITNKEEVEALMNFTKKQGALSGVVHTAGVSETVNDVEQIYNINLKGTALILDGVLDIVDEGASIVLFSSMMGHTVPPSDAYDEALTNPLEENSFSSIKNVVKEDSNMMYNFTKRGVLLLTKENAQRFGAKGARVNSISPGVIMTQMGKKAAEEHPEKIKQLLSMTALNRTGEPEDIADVVKFMLSEQSRFMSGSDLLVDGGVLPSILKYNK
ncbi:short-chain dehydrogenase [Brumimicrobium salinarum]|uniref:Short-chain dehydrogenase n=1 Tax=Brumimicrobium salinarum TaxID=2058658 RepID=A0A2I0R4T0_9FLAO|nr:SDR family oxidoreductase [Brumimicrobium salinarum]PKR81591.1 short-chain dehydrogenase [Brumimicrobium salinarum]